MPEADTEADTGFAPVFLRLPASPRYLRVARVVAGVLANELGADIDALDDVRLAVGEACSLAVAAGAETIELYFEVTDGTLTVDGTARPAPVSLDAELSLTRQILGVAATHHELTVEPAAVSFRLSFRVVG